MDLLPKNHKQFQEEEFWSTFFQNKKGKQGFEWYATYEELENCLKTTIKNRQAQILVVGTGNSMLAEKMSTVLGLPNIIAVDYEAGVIKKMKEKQTKVDYRVIDMLNMSEIEDGSIDYVVDKGTLDALCSDESQETKEKVVKYFSEIQRVINPNWGTYACVSLLQDFVLKTLIDFFSKGEGNKEHENVIIDFRIQKVEKIHPETFLPFYVTIKKTQINKQDPKFVELRNKLSQTVNYQDSYILKPEIMSVHHIPERIKREQITNFCAPNLKELSLGQKYDLYVYDKSIDSVIPRYTLTVIDSSYPKILKKRSCGSFIIPQGRERETTFSTDVGRINLVNQAGYSRLIIITLNHGHTFQSIENVQKELSPKIIDLAPKRCSNLKEIPFLTVGKDIGERGLIYKSEDQTLIVEDYIDENGAVFRSVVFSQKPEQVQSEIQLVYRNSKKGAISEELKTQSTVAHKKKQRILVYNHELLCSEYQQSMLAGLSLSKGLASKDKVRALVLGTGAGALPMFLKSQLGDSLSEVVTVDISEEMVKVAKDYFGLVEDEKLKSYTQDAYKFVQDSQKEKFDMIFMDINYEEENLALSPPLKFIETAFLDKLMNMLTEEGFLSFNLLTYDQETLERAYSLIKAVQAGGKQVSEGEEEVNKVIVLSKGQATPQDERVDVMESAMKKWGINKGIWFSEMQVKEQALKLRNLNSK